MADLTPKIVRMYDSQQLQPGGAVRNTTVVQFLLGAHGPYEHVFDRGPQRFQIDQVIAERRASLEGLV